MTNGDDTEVIVKEILALNVVFPESFTVNCGLKIPGATVGVPPNEPVDGLMLIPSGRPVADQV